MAGFSFGNVGELNASVTVQCFVYVVFFIMFFDAFVGVIEYFLEGSPLYHRMIQTIYKELMLMGIVSFIITMILALESYKHTHSEEGTKWIKGIEFAHILLFFLTFFFVGHACILMRTSFKSRSHYRTTFALGVSEVLNDASSISTNPIQYFLFKFNIFPAIGVKERMELWLFHELFRATYWLPYDFNFADYLSGCFDQYILKTIERSFFTWIVLIVLAVLNYARIRLHIGFQTCKRPNADTASAAHRLLGGDSSSAVDATHGNYDQNVCNYNMFRLFLIGGAVLVVCNFIVVYVARLYRIRMFHRIGILGTNDYVDFLEFVRDEDEKELAERKKPGASSNSAMTTSQLKNDIQTVLDEDEHEEEVEFKELAEAILSAVNYAWELKDSIVVTLRSTWARVVRGVQTRKFNLISPLGAMDTEAAVGNGDHGSDTASNSPNSDPHNVPASSKLNRLHRSSAARPNNTPSTTAGTVATPANKEESSATGIRPAEKTDPATSVTPAIALGAAPHAPAPRTQGGRRRSVVGDGAHAHAQMESIRSLLLTLDAPGELDGSHLHSGMNRPNRPRLHSQESVTLIDHSASAPNNTTANHSNSHTPGAGAAIDGRRRTSILVSNATGSSNSLDDRRNSLTHGTGATRRRNSVHVVAPKDELSRVERYKLQKAQNNPSYAIALKKMHDKMLRDQARMQAAEARTWWMWCLSWFRSNDMLANKDELTANAGTDIENSVPNNGDLKEEARLDEDFHSIYIFGQPTLFVRIIEITIMFNCLYMAFWLSNFITITGQLHTSNDWEILNEMAMLIPIVLVIPCVIYISETASLLSAISELNLHVIYQVLCDTEDTQNLLRDFKRKLKARVVMIQKLNFDKDEVLRILFQEIDQDGSGVIDMTEFRVLLRHLKLKYSDDRFKRLFHAIAGDSEITFDELKELVDHVGDDEEQEDTPAVVQNHHGTSKKTTHNHDASGKITNNHNNTSSEASGSNGEATNGAHGHGRLTQADLRNKFSRPDRLKNSLSNNNSSSSNDVSHISEKRDEVKSDNESDSASVGDQFADFAYERPSQIQAEQFRKMSNSTATVPKLRSVSSVDYSDTDSEDDGNNSGKKKRLSHRKSGRDRKLNSGESVPTPAAAVTPVADGQIASIEDNDIKSFSVEETNANDDNNKNIN